ncbi:YIP1 family protein [Anthocerotibacter panamensis]|uniref:YIP1 family protein n=1 Tax=Anthocerotibacter panamensis TaxID=2857077 RepID=UPI001C4059E6|nr:YIP1 family protein [Anthocerotibacter panamensis]
MSNFLDNCFGSWFEPQQTFERLALDPPLLQAALIIAGVNILEGLRLGGVGGACLQVFFGVVGWLLLNGLLHLLLTAFGQNPSYRRLLALTGFASLPWLLVPPGVTLGGPIGGLLVLGALVWFVALQTWAVAQATALDWWRVALLVPLTFAGALVALTWTVDSLIKTIGLSQ